MSGRSGGSRFLYDPFDMAAAKIESNEKVQAERWRALERRLVEIERMLERQERRIWLAVYGAAALFAGDRIYELLSSVST